VYHIIKRKVQKEHTHTTPRIFLRGKGCRGGCRENPYGAILLKLFGNGKKQPSLREGLNLSICNFNISLKQCRQEEKKRSLIPKDAVIPLLPNLTLSC
jgi:hypothetical protein